VRAEISILPVAHKGSPNQPGYRVRLEDRYCGTDLFGQCELFWGNIDGRDMQAHSLRILDREMPEAADPRIATHSPGRAGVSFSPLYVVTPAHRIGAMCANSVPL
jgi:hypothetical protein